MTLFGEVRWVPSSGSSGAPARRDPAAAFERYTALDGWSRSKSVARSATWYPGRRREQGCDCPLPGGATKSRCWKRKQRYAQPAKSRRSENNRRGKVHYAPRALRRWNVCAWYT